MTKEISVEDKLSTCMWLKLGEGNWKPQKLTDFADLVGLQMDRMHMFTILKGKSDSLSLHYIHGGISKRYQVT